MFTDTTEIEVKPRVEIPKPSVRLVKIQPTPQNGNKARVLIRIDLDVTDAQPVETEKTLAYYGLSGGLVNGENGKPITDINPATGKNEQARINLLMYFPKAKARKDDAGTSTNGNGNGNGDGGSK